MTRKKRNDTEHVNRKVNTFSRDEIQGGQDGEQLLNNTGLGLDSSKENDKDNEDM